jgi:hypothetical protein
MLAISFAAAGAAPSWGKWIPLALAVHAFYCVFNERQRDAAYGECYRLRFMKRNGHPASVRTALFAFVLWSSAFVSFFFPNFWEWDYSGLLFIGAFASVMLSSYIDARSFRTRHWR